MLGFAPPGSAVISEVPRIVRSPFFTAGRDPLFVVGGNSPRDFDVAGTGTPRNWTVRKT